MEKIRVNEKRFVDSLGRERIFNGVNIVDKSDYTPGKQVYNGTYGHEVNDELINELAEKGVNLIRLGFVWDKLEPKPGEYNDEYIDRLGEIIDLCEKHEIYVYLDMHQDLYSSTCNGDGAPEWATFTDGYKVRPIKFVWAEIYFWSKACHRAFDNFWDNRLIEGKGVQEYYADCWRHIASRLGDKPAVIGFDLMNEPFPGTDGGKVFKTFVKEGIKTVLFSKKIKKSKMIKDLFSRDRVPKILSQINYDVMRTVTSACDRYIYNFDINKYAPFLSKTASAVREKSEDGIFFMENSYYSNTGIPFSAPRISVNGKNESQQVFAPHAYDLMVDTPAYKYASNERVAGIFSEHKRSQDRLNMPVVVGDWGGFGGPGDDWLPHIAFLLDLFDTNKWSNTYWCYVPKFLESPLMKVFVRPYPKAVAGVITMYRYNRDSKEFSLFFESENKKKQKSIIYVPDEPKSVTLDSKEIEPKISGHELVIETTGGSHSLKIAF